MAQTTYAKAKSVPCLLCHARPQRTCTTIANAEPSYVDGERFKYHRERFNAAQAAYEDDTFVVRSIPFAEAPSGVALFHKYCGYIIDLPNAATPTLIARAVRSHVCSPPDDDVEHEYLVSLSDADIDALERIEPDDIDTIKQIAAKFTDASRSKARHR